MRTEHACRSAIAISRCISARPAGAETRAWLSRSVAAAAAHAHDLHRRSRSRRCRPRGRPARSPPGKDARHELGQAHLVRHRRAGGRVAADRQPGAARRPHRERGHAQADRGGRAAAQLHRRQECVGAAPPPVQHAGAAIVRGSDLGRFDDQPLLPVDAGVDHAHLRAALLRPADLVPADVDQLACRL